MSKTYLLVCLLLILEPSIEGARILGILHVPVKSHYNVGFPILKGLADKGHDVTIASAFSSNNKTVNYRDIYIDGIQEIGDGIRGDMFEMENKSPFTMLSSISNFTHSLVNTTLHSPGIQKLIKAGEKFDVVIFGAFGSDAFIGLQHIFNSHMIVVSSGTSEFVNHLTGNVVPISFVPSAMATHSDKMTFVQRATNALMRIGFKFMNDYYTFPGQKDIYVNFFKNVPSFEETVKNVSLVFTNTHVLFESPRPYLPNMIPIGGIQLSAPKKLPQDLQTILDSSKDGVILFSLGSNLHSKNLPESAIQAIIKTFAKFPQHILWKFEDEALQKRLPKNVRISKWYPQTDLLAHPNLKLFITHGGLLSSTEAVYRGVPIVGIPVYADQFANIAKLVSSGYGQQILLPELTEETFTSVIKEVLGNESYRQKIKQASEILQDQIDHPKDRAVFWVEHVIKTKGARHLRSASLDLSLAQYLLLDVLAFAGIVVGTFVTGIYLVVKTLCCKRKADQRRDKKKSKKE